MATIDNVTESGSSMVVNFPAVGRSYLVDFVVFKVKLSFSSDTSLTYSVVGTDGRLGQIETVAIKVEKLADSLFLVTWQEADKTTVVHVEDYNQKTIITNITNPDLSFDQYHGTFIELPLASTGVKTNFVAAQSPTYSRDILPLFRVTDINCMKRRGVELDNSDWMCNLINAREVYDQISSGNMPPDVPWQAANITLFKAWMDDGCLP